MASPPDASGTLPPRYSEAVLLARGGMSDVYRATDTLLARSVAVKLLAAGFSGDSEARVRFEREARAAARLSDDPGIVTVFDIGEWQERPYIVMEFAPGGSLADRFARHERASREQTLAWLAAAGRALDHAHSHGVVHRDVKPANLLFGARGELLVADFGIATAAGLESVTLTGTVLGTAGYLSPEQAQGRPAGASSDRYALAVVAYELLTGARPFERDSLAAEAIAGMHEPVPPASSRNPQLPAAVDPLFERALALDPEARFRSCGAFVAALSEALGSSRGALPARDASAAATVVLAPRRRSRRPFVAAAALALAALAGVLVALATQGGERAVLPPTPPTAAQSSAQTTATTTASTTGPPATSASPPPAVAALIAHGLGLLAQGSALAALPLLQQANRELNGSGSPNEGRADAALARAIVGVGSCSGVISLVDRAEQLLGKQSALEVLRADCAAHAPPGHGHGNDHGHGNGNGNGG